MKPSFALNLTESGAGLLHRTARGWMPVGEVAFESADLTEALRYLRRSALGLSPRGLQSKVVIPNSQILYLTLLAPGPDAVRRRAQITEALEGRTPYAVDDLVFDWRGTGDTVQVAVVARETLLEAEDFAHTHKFNPVSFVAIPEAGAFAGEPWFGLSRRAARYLPEGEKVDRDQDPIMIIARDWSKSDLPEAVADVEDPEAAEDIAAGPAPMADAVEPVPAAEGPEPELVAVAPTPPELAPEPSSAKPAPEVPPAVAPPAPELPEAPAMAAPTDPVAAPEQMPREAEPEVAALVAAMAKRKAPNAVATPEPVAPEAAAAEPVAKAAARPLPKVEVPAAPMAEDVPDPGELPQRAQVTATRAFPDPKRELDDVPAAPSASAMMAFAARREAEKPMAAPVRAAPARTAVPAPVAERLTQRGAGKSSDGPVARPKQARVPPTMGTVPPVNGGPMLKAVETAGAMSQPSVSKVVAVPVTAPSIPGTKKRKAQTASVQAATANNPNPAKPLTKPGGTFGSRPQRGKPKYLGLILTGLLLVFLALVAAWSTYVVAFRNTGETAVATAEVVPGIEDEILADQQDPAEFAASDTGAAVEPPTPLNIEPATAPDTLAALPPEAAPGADLPPATDETVTSTAALPPATDETVTSAAALPPATPEAAPAQEAAAEATPAAPEPAPGTVVGSDAPASTAPSETQDEIFLSTTDIPPPALDPASLPPLVAQADPPPAPQLEPPPFGTVYQFDEAGLIRPTPEGIITPEGVRLVAGKPPIVPPTRPEALATATTPDAPTEAPAIATPAPAIAASANPAAGASTAGVATAPVAAEAPFPSDPALANARPRSRPDGLTPPPTQAEDDAGLAIAPVTRLSSLRPQPRPKTVLAAGEAARQASRSSSLAAQAAAVDAALAEANVTASAAIDPNASALAIAVSRKPASRPKDLTPSVQAAAAAAVRPVEPDIAAPSAEPEAQEEPEIIATAAPRIPTRATVAKQATFVNAINLSKINLIGVYGTPSNRYALVRQGNGRYKRVEVGDSVDGGRVAAITATEVRYQKGGRLVSLSMPKG